MSTDPFAQLDAAYVLGALDADDLTAYEAHLRGCAECRARVEELRPTVQLLAVARAAGTDLGDPPPVPDTLLAGLLRRAARERARRRWATRGVAVLAAACLAALIVVLWPATSHEPAPRALVAVRPTPVAATARLVDKPWGTEIDVHCRYEHYVALPDTRYGLRVVDRDHTTHDLGTWSLPSQAITFVGGTAVRRDRIARVEVTLPDGTPVLQLSL